jgi:hypothetical protein
MPSDHADGRRGLSRCTASECTTSAGTSVLRLIGGRMPRSIGIIDDATAAEQSKVDKGISMHCVRIWPRLSQSRNDA